MQGTPGGMRFGRVLNSQDIENDESRTSKRASAPGWARQPGLPMWAF